MHAFQRFGVLPAAVFATMPSLLGGCTGFGDYFKNGLKVGPNYEQPPAPVPSHWIEADDARVRSDTQNLSQWWSVFNDPTLDSLIDEAAAQNLSLREAGFRILQARATLGFSQGNFWPQTQEAFGGYSRQRVSTNSATGSSITDRSFDDWTVGFGVAWELDLWGKFRRAIESSEASLDASIDSYGDVLVTLLGDVATNYVQYRVLERQIELVKQNVDLQRTTLTLADARFRGGQTSELDVEQARSNLAQTEA
ncbi:MAG: TolC family protein, partial [Rhodanobacteraceae bacterium]